MKFAEFTDLGFSTAINPKYVVCVEAQDEKDEGRTVVHMADGKQFNLDQSYEEVIKELRKFSDKDIPFGMFSSTTTYR